MGFNCNDCSTFPSGGNRRERCKAACRDSQVNQVEDCIDADTCSECRKYCGSGVVLDECYDDVGCSSAEDSRDDCDNAKKCGDCKKFCSGSETKDCQKDLCDSEELIK